MKKDKFFEVKLMMNYYMFVKQAACVDPSTNDPSHSVSPVYFQPIIMRAKFCCADCHIFGSSMTWDRSTMHPK